MTERAGYEPGDDEVLPEQTSDDTDRGWGEDPTGSDPAYDPDVERLLREKPPHW